MRKHHLAKRNLSALLSPIVVAVVLLYIGIAGSLAGPYYGYAGQQGTPFSGFLTRYMQYELKNGEEVLEEGKLSELSFGDAGEYTLGMRLLGVLPVQEASLSVISAGELVPGRQSLGIILKAEGVIVVGFSGIASESGEMLYPCRDADIRLGDSIVSIDGIDVTSDTEASALINEKGADGDLEIEIRRGGDTTVKTVKTVLCPETGTYRLGVYIRDDTGGVGTLSFYDPVTGRYGALGHTIPGAASNEDEGDLIGRIMPAEITGVKRAGHGDTGEKIGYFNPGSFEGEIDTIGQYGIFGSLSDPLQNELLPSVMPARPDQVKKEKAQIITVIEGSQMEFFDIEILNIDKRDDEGKGLLIEVTDERLLTVTGGIIQGMSGSPIIQDGLLVGTVTYVMVNSPQKGYGCLIHKMLSESGVL